MARHRFYKNPFFHLLLFWALLSPVRPVSAQTSPLVLTIDPATEYGRISPYLYGVNIPNWCAWYYLNMVSPLLRQAEVSVVRLGATNFERYNYENNRMFNAVARANEYVPLSWRSFIAWSRDEVGAEPFLQTSVFGHVAGDGQGVGDSDYDRVQSPGQVQSWAEIAGAQVKFWGVGNEPFIAWKRYDYPGIYSDLAHGDQVLNTYTSYSYYFDRFRQVAEALKNGRDGVLTFGPTPANWFLYWSNEYSPFCPVTSPNGPAQPANPGWQTMSDPLLTWDQSVFPDRGGDPEETGWETDTQRMVCQFLSRMNQSSSGGRRLADYLDVHRYIRCIKEFDAVQEPRGLWQDDFASWDMETLYSGIQTRVLKRLQGAVQVHDPGAKLSFSEYGFFYWDGHPGLSQNSAIGTMDFLGFFARGGVEVACNWYVGEPNQSAGDFTHGVDSAKQAMFDEQGRPNPKYWVFYLMSHYFHGTCIKAEASDWDRFSVHACRTDEGDYIVVAAYKGEYDPATGELLANQTPAVAGLAGIPAGRGLKRLFRLGLNDPQAVAMDTSGLNPAGGQLNFTFQPLAIYLFEFSSESSTLPEQAVIVGPERIDFGPYDTGLLQNGTTEYTRAIKVTNTTPGRAGWSASEDSSWLEIAGDTAGSASVTDLIKLVVNRDNLAPGSYQTEVTVSTAEGEVVIPVSMDVIPGEAGGEKRISDFETGSLAHSWNMTEPYAIGWWDGHGGPEDQDSPYIHRFYLDHQELSRLGDTTSLKIEFNRANGDTENGRLYLPFGTYGHQTTTTDDNGNPVVYKACGDWTGYDSFQVDLKTETNDSDITAIELIFSDLAGHRGKPDVLISAYTEPMDLADGLWQTIIVPLTATFFDWQAQDGSLVEMDFRQISQIEVLVWAGDGTKSGTVFLDNLRLVKADPSGNQFPLARTGALVYYADPGQPVQLDGTSSLDPDGQIAKYQWLPADHLSDPNSPRPFFQAEAKGDYLVDLVVTDGQDLASRNIAQVLIRVGQNGGGSGSTSSGGAGVSGGCFLGSTD